MENDLILQIDNVGPISHAKINIGKINIIGGNNSTGKSTASKLLYCFLRANSPGGEKLIIRNVSFLMKDIIRKIRPFSHKRMNIDDDSHIYRYKYVDDNESMISREESEELANIDEILSKHVFSNEENLSAEDLINFHDFFNGIFDKISLKFDDNDPRFKSLNRIMVSMNDTINNLLYNPAELYNSILRQLIASEFNIKGPSPSDNIAKLECSNLDIEDVCDFKNYDFNHRNPIPIEQIYYLDSFSILDRFRNGLFDTDHVTSLRDDLLEDSGFKAGIHDNLQVIIQNMEKCINTLIDGRLEFNNGGFEYVSNDGVSSQMRNTASGIKQIGVIQRLLSNYKLYPGSFLFIDEPEVNLHPQWQVKLANILILLANDLDISLYINTHSPLFIEAIRTFADEYDLLDDTNFYLTKDDSPNKYSFERIASDDLYIIFEELGKPYDYLDEIQMAKMFKDRIKK